MTSLSAMTPSQSNMTRSTVRNASATRLLPSRRKNLSRGRLDGKHETPFGPEDRGRRDWDRPGFHV